MLMTMLRRILMIFIILVIFRFFLLTVTMPMLLLIYYCLCLLLRMRLRFRFLFLLYLWIVLLVVFFIILYLLLSLLLLFLFFLLLLFLSFINQVLFICHSCWILVSLRTCFFSFFPNLIFLFLNVHLDVIFVLPTILISLAISFLLLFFSSLSLLQAVLIYYKLIISRFSSWCIIRTLWRRLLILLRSYHRGRYHPWICTRSYLLILWWLRSSYSISSWSWRGTWRWFFSLRSTFTHL